MTRMSNDDLQMQDFSQSFYHRPHDATIPIPTGNVKPYPVKEDGSWDLSEEEPMVPRASLRRRRNVLTLAVIAFTIGSLLIILSSPYSNEFLAPGPLHSSHAQLLAGKGADRCAACHSGASNSSAFGWVAHAFSGASNKATQSTLCMECHKTTLGETYAFNPHNVAPEELAKKSSKFKNASFMPKMTRPPVTANNEIACSACHREHKGAQDLKAMTDAQCQSCHQSNFHSFETDHPEFTNWPESSKQNIAFDHSTHFSKHFPAEKANFDCNRCHIDDAWQNVKVMAPFQQACASCHEESIVDSGTKGFAVLALPMLDMKAIEAQKLGVGSWPLAATGDFDGPIPPAMRLLLMADPDAGPILKSKPKSFEFMDFDPGNPADVRDAVTLVWSIKRLVHEFSYKGSSAFHRRLEIVLGRSIDPNEAKGMLGGLDSSSFAAAARRWFPKIGSEIKQKFGGVIDLGLSDTVGRQGYLASISVQDLLAENPLADGMQDSAEVASSEPTLEVPDTELSQPEISQPSLVESDSEPEPGSLLPIAEPTEKVRNKPQAPRKEVAASPQRQQTSVASSTPVRPMSETPVAVAKRDTNDGTQTGWIRDDVSLRLYYRPHGHEDKFLKHWIDLVLETPDAENLPATSSLYSSLTKTTSIGNCRYCHTMKRTEDMRLVMNWEEDRRDGSKGQFTSFSHRPHLVQPVLQDCSHCHQMDLTVSNKELFASVDRTDHKSNFHPIQKATCASCHQKGLTENSCTTCHDYHVGAHKSQ